MNTRRYNNNLPRVSSRLFPVIRLMSSDFERNAEHF